MKFVFLIGSYVPHQMTTINTLIKNYDVEIFSYSISKNFKYIPENVDNLHTSLFFEKTKEERLNEILILKPDAVIVSGWMIKEYVWICKRLKKKNNFPTVAMTDTPWYGTLKQKVNCLISNFHIKMAFSHVWVAGITQYDYARKLGFSNSKILHNSLSANINSFLKVDMQKKNINYPKNFIFVGRLTEVKGISNLIEAWKLIEDKKDWTFTIIGDGEMKELIIEESEFIVKDFMNHENLILEFQNSGCFILPSLHEPWALVIHEAASAGLPIICTETCGASIHFVVDNYNGFKIKNNSIKDLKEKIEIIINSETEELINFSNKSRELSKSINPDLSVACLMQLFHE